MLRASAAEASRAAARGGRPRRHQARARGRRRRAADGRGPRSRRPRPGLLLDALAEADAVMDRPSVIFAYTIKAWRLPTEGHPANHSALLDADQWRTLAGGLGADPRVRGRGSTRARPRPSCAPRPPPGSPRAGDATRRPGALGARPRARRPRLDPAGVRALVRRSGASGARGRRARRHRQPRCGLLHQPRRLDQPGRDLASRPTGSTGSPTTPTPSCAGARASTASTSSSASPRATSSGCWPSWALTWSRDGEPLLPIGTLYDPFVNRALEPWSFGLYAGASRSSSAPPRASRWRRRVAPTSRSSPLGGARAASLRGVGTGLRPGPRVDAAGGAGAPGPARRHVLLLPADHAPDRPGARAAARGSAERQRAARVGAGGRLSPAAGAGAPAVTLVGVGAVMPEVLAAADELAAAGHGVDVVCLTSPDLVFRACALARGWPRATTRSSTRCCRPSARPRW